LISALTFKQPADIFRACNATHAGNTTEDDTMNAETAMKTKIASLETAQLVEIARALNLATSSEEIITSTYVALELEQRLEESVFGELMAELESELMAA
jgi:hypothetical protein